MSYTDTVTGLTKRLLDEADRPVDPHRAIPTGIRDLDDILAGGLRTGQLAVLTGETGVGASTFALTIARHAAMHREIPTVFLAPESPSTEIGLRVIAAETMIRHRSLRSRALDDREQQLLRDKRTRIAAAPLSVIADKDDVLSPEGVLEDIRYLSSAPGVRLIVMDGLSCAGRLREVMPELGALASSQHIAVLMTCPQRALPALMDAVDLVLSLGKPTFGEVDVDIVKHRYGPTATIQMGALEHYATFANLANDT